MFTPDNTTGVPDAFFPYIKLSLSSWEAMLIWQYYFWLQNILDTAGKVFRYSKGGTQMGTQPQQCPLEQRDLNRYARVTAGFHVVWAQLSK